MDIIKHIEKKLQESRESIEKSNDSYFDTYKGKESIIRVDGNNSDDEWSAGYDSGQYYTLKSLLEELKQL